MIADPVQAFWITFGISAILAYPIYRALLALKARQTIDPFAPEGHQVKQGTPTMGGLIILAGLIPGLLFTQRDHSMLIACVSFMLIGFIDDFIVPRMKGAKRGLGWKQKIVLQLFAAFGTAMLIPSIAGDWPKIGIAVFLILFLSNAFNLADGLDGLSGGLLVVLGLWISATMFGNPVGWLFIAATLPFLFLNAPPAKIFMGDVGSLPIGAMLGLLFSVWLLPPDVPLFSNLSQWAAAIVASIVLILELVLVPIQVGYYKKTKKRLFPATPIHHGFEKMGWPESKVVWTFILFQAICCMASYTILQRSLEATAVTRELSSGANETVTK